LVQFWKQVYGIGISPDEIPLLKVKMMNSENVFTYPPSMCFFGNETLLIYANVQKFIENKKYSLKAKVDDAVRKAVQEQDLHIGAAKLEVDELAAFPHPDVQSQLLQEIRQKLFGRMLQQEAQLCLYTTSFGSFLIRYNFHKHVISFCTKTIQ
jgi:hypothetical protein